MNFQFSPNFIEFQLFYQNWQEKCTSMFKEGIKVLKFKPTGYTPFHHTSETISFGTPLFFKN